MEYTRLGTSGITVSRIWSGTFLSALDMAGCSLSILPVAILVILAIIFFRQQIRMAGKGALNFGKSKARMLSRIER